MKKELTNIGSAPLTHREQALLDKDKLKVDEVIQDKPNTSKCGVNNPAKFGEHNPNFNKHNIN